MSDTRYHHGDLPNALRAAAADVIDEKGLGAFSLREVARRAGVSHAAPAHHFGDMRGLLTSLAIEGLHLLAAAMIKAADGVDDPRERLVLMGRAYFVFAMENPGHNAVMFRKDVVNDDDPTLDEAGHEAFQHLEDTIAAIDEAESLDLDIGDATKMCWATMQGLVELWPTMFKVDQGRCGAADDPVVVVERVARLLADGLSRQRGQTPLA